MRYTETAVADLHGLASYAREHLDEGAIGVLVGTLREAIEALMVQFPDVGRPGRVPGTRELVLTRVNVVVTYRAEGKELWMLTVLRAEHQRIIIEPWNIHQRRSTST